MIIKGGKNRKFIYSSTGYPRVDKRANRAGSGEEKGNLRLTLSRNEEKKQTNRIYFLNSYSIFAAIKIFQFY